VQGPNLKNDTACSGLGLHINYQLRQSPTHWQKSTQ
ncbi:hypothetical protein LEMLEM_LOCUS10483, partial [Lemmus lemmus]